MPVPNLPSSDEVLERFVRNEQPGSQTCRGCQCSWIPASWNFFGLCEPCFTRWQAVQVKVPPPETYTHITPEHGYYCSCDDWIVDGCPDPPSEPFTIHWREQRPNRANYRALIARCAVAVLCGPFWATGVLTIVELVGIRPGTPTATVIGIVVMISAIPVCFWFANWVIPNDP